MKKYACLCIILFLAVFVAAPCALAAKKEFTVYLAASMTKPAKALAEKFNAEHEDMEILLNIGSSGELISKMEVAKIGDIFIPASDGFLKQVQDKGFAVSAKPFLQQWPVFCLSKSGEELIKSFDDLAKPGLIIALGNPKTTALGQNWAVIETKLPPEQAKAIRANMTIEAAQANQIVQYIKTDVVNAGLLFDSIAQANNFSYVSIPAEINVPETSYLVTLSFSRHSAKDLELVRQYILDNIAIFEKEGYSKAQ